MVISTILLLVAIGVIAYFKTGGGAKTNDTARQVRGKKDPSPARASPREPMRTFSLEPIAVDSLPTGPVRDPKQHYFRCLLGSGEFVYLGCSPGHEWVDVATRKRRTGEKDGRFTGEYADFGFSTSRRNWSYGSGPPAAAEIRQIIKVLETNGLAGSAAP